MQLPVIRSAAAHALSETVDLESRPFFPVHPLNRPWRAPGALRTTKHLLCQMENEVTVVCIDSVAQYLPDRR